jgi:hypothetical protein
MPEKTAFCHCFFLYPLLLAYSPCEKWGRGRIQDQAGN